nr:FAD-dependent oxidoreductase [Pseudomonas peli]
MGSVPRRLNAGGTQGDRDRAGCAGLAAAQRLRAQGIDCIVLEARGRTGGRTHTVELGGVKADEGVHGFKFC